MQVHVRVLKLEGLVLRTCLQDVLDRLFWADPSAPVTNARQIELNVCSHQSSPGNKWWEG
jgi:hypothetical protein